MFLILGCGFTLLALHFDLAFAFSQAPLNTTSTTLQVTTTTTLKAAEDSFTFVALGDNRDGEGTFLKLIGLVNQEDEIAFVVNTGDFVSSGKRSQYLAYLKLIGRLKVKTYNVPGNHDMVYGGHKYFKEFFGPDYYSFDHKNSHFVVINNAFKRSFDVEQFAWLKLDLAGTDKENIFVFMHRPTFDPTEIYKSYVMSGRQVTEELMRVFQKYKVDYVMAGHLHGYARAKRKGVVYVVTGGAGAPLYLPNDFGGFHHYVRITIDGNKIKDEVIKLYD